MEQGRLPKDFLTVKAAIELINSDTREDPVVDTTYLVRHTPWLEAKHNFNIPLLKRDPKTGRIMKAGHRYVYVETDSDRVLLERCIVDKYKELARREFDDNERVRHMTTVVSDSENGGNMSGRLMVDKSGNGTKYGESLKSSEG